MFKAGAFHLSEFSRAVAQAAAVVVLALPVILVLWVVAVAVAGGCCNDELLPLGVACIVAAGCGIVTTLIALAKGPYGVMRFEQRAARSLLRATQRRVLTAPTCAAMLARVVEVWQLRVERFCPVRPVARVIDINLTPRLLPAPIAR